MPVEVTLRHLTSNEATKAYAEKRAQQILDKFPKVENVRVIIDHQNDLVEAEIVAQRKDKVIVGTKEHAETIRSVIDMAAARVEKQIRRIRTKIANARVRNVPHRNV